MRLLSIAAVCVLAGAAAAPSTAWAQSNSTASTVVT